MKFARELNSLPLLLACLSTVQASGKIIISGIPIIQPDAPAQLVSIQKTLQNQVATLTLKNTSDRAISSVKIGWSIDIPVGCSTVPIATKANHRTFQLSMASNATATLKDLGPTTNDLLEMGHSEAAGVISVQVAVIGVDFADGSNWTSPLPQDQTFNRAELASLSRYCSNGKLAANAGAGGCTASTRETDGLVSADSSPVPNVGCFFFCTAALAKAGIFCENHISSCTNAICPNPKACPGQECEFMCN